MTSFAEEQKINFISFRKGVILMNNQISLSCWKQFSLIVLFKKKKDHGIFILSFAKEIKATCTVALMLKIINFCWLLPLSAPTLIACHVPFLTFCIISVLICPPHKTVSSWKAGNRSCSLQALAFHLPAQQCVQNRHSINVGLQMF